ncbi:alanine--tRNA ligase [Caldisalinibacter kiritimatiensis]|uniref:Alanine--tRNA ligase n=1 Tax=Caldisalinibacter kiritimatiensis TaxID=1304284 RepID=R1CTE3_9FIRM|nr:alanine--tRNA ligase [Caldisalinibacter kiritimatiensis]EOC99953.1 Alanyl-tRNA synthetase [Caldisalinibacter kiritimatiensis]
MKRLSLDEIRKEFLNFFEEKDHLVAPSFSLVPKGDKSLLLINAGMAPLKKYFTGAEEPPKRRMATCQKCVRTGDIDNVGKTARHATFFEMLGNFSFGDYFKKEAIKWAWEFMTERLEVSEDKLWVSVYEEDDEAYEIWKKEVGISEDRIVRLGKEDNFWELEVGPSGPCSELYIDRGEQYGCGSEDCKPGCDCDRYVEVWNLVFSQFDKDEKGNYNPLPNPNIDTGMGLERIAAVMQDAANIFEVEPIKTILTKVEEISGINYGKNDKDDMSIRVITDHTRAMTFMVSDGVIPSNEGRGYVLRRLIRRAARHGKLLGIEGNFLTQVVDVVINKWKETYPELKEREVQIKKVIQIEEEKFQETIDQGMNILEEYIKDIKDENKDTLSGEKAFKLYDTYGFPLDLTKEILFESGLKVDEDGFNKEMEEQRERARKARGDIGNEAWSSEGVLKLDENVKTDFDGYENFNLKTKVIELIKEDEIVEELSKDETGIIILEKTPLYAEGGGQVGDKGLIKNSNFVAEVTDTKKGTNDSIFHFVKIKEGTAKKGDIVEAIVDKRNRLNAARNHTATHILHKVLKEVLGEHVNQAGSLVTPQRLRFDFTHFEAIDKETLAEIEDKVNSKIQETLDVNTKETSMKEAKAMGATALFDEKYGDKVRVVSVGDYSIELCGGTHVNNSSQIGLFKIVSEAGIASGVRRIEAITGESLYKDIKETDAQINKLTQLLKTNKNDLINRVQSLNNEVKELVKEIETLKSKLASSKMDDIVNEVKEIEGIKVIAKKIEGMDMNSLRQLGDKIRDKVGSVIVVLGSTHGEKVSFVSMATKDLISKGIHAGNLIREVAKITGGGGGGRPDMAQAGGKDASKIDEALDKVYDLVKKQISNG